MAGYVCKSGSSAPRSAECNKDSFSELCRSNWRHFYTLRLIQTNTNTISTIRTSYQSLLVMLPTEYFMINYVTCFYYIHLNILAKQ